MTSLIVLTIVAPCYALISISVPRAPNMSNRVLPLSILNHTTAQPTILCTVYVRVLATDGQKWSLNSDTNVHRCARFAVTMVASAIINHPSVSPSCFTYPTFIYDIYCPSRTSKCHSCGVVSSSDIKQRHLGNNFVKHGSKTLAEEAQGNR